MGCLFLQRGISISKSIERILSRMEVLTVQEVGYLEKWVSFIDHQEFSFVFLFVFVFRYHYEPSHYS